MRAVLDTNILISGVFFGGVPRRILDAWSEGRFELVLTPLIFDEYVRTCERLADSRPGLEYQAALALIVGHGTLLADTDGHEPVTPDPDDDKFILCALKAGAVVVSGDKHLLEASGWSDTRVLRARAFLDLLAAQQ